MNKQQQFLIMAATMGLSLVRGTAWAEAEAVAAREVSVAVTAHRFGAMVALPTDELSRQRGGQDLSQVLGTARLSGVVSDNSATNLGTGANTIADGAFANAMGLPVVIQNSGNNVLIQSSTIVNVQLK